MPNMKYGINVGPFYVISHKKFDKLNTDYENIFIIVYICELQ